MLKPLTIVLIFSFLSCAKEESTKSGTSQLAISDYDHDGIANQRDSNPFVADLPKPHFKLSVWDQDQLKPLAWTINKNLINQLNEIVAKAPKQSFHKASKLPPVKVLHKSRLPILNNFVNFELSKLSHPNMSISLENQNNRLYQFLPAHQGENMSLVHQSLLTQDFISYQVHDFDYQMDGKSFSYALQKEQVQQNNYEVFIISKKGSKSYYFSPLLTPAEALELIPETSFEDILNQRNRWLTKDLKLIPAREAQWFLFNQSVDWEKPLPPGSKLILFKSSKRDLMLTQSRLEQVDVSFKNNRVQVSLKDIWQVKPRLEGDLLIPRQKFRLHRKKIKLPLTDKKAFCEVKEFYIEWKKQDLSLEYFDFFVNGAKQMTFAESISNDSAEVRLELKPQYLQKLKKGFISHYKKRKRELNCKKNPFNNQPFSLIEEVTSPHVKGHASLQFRRHLH